MSAVDELLAGVPAERGTRLQFYGLVDCLLVGVFGGYLAVLRLATLVSLFGRGVRVTRRTNFGSSKKSSNRFTQPEREEI